MLIAISQRRDKNKYGNYIDNLEENYVNYLEKFGIRLIVIPNSTKNVFDYFKDFLISGIILSGGNDINPELYGRKQEESMSVSKARDDIEKKMLEIAIKKKVPVLGICRGMQFINVFFKGKLIDTKDHIKNHNIRVTDDELLPFLGKEIKVNSYHNYGIDEESLSSELKVFAKSPDGIIEGIYHLSLPIAGIQWHPERESPDEDVNKKIVKAFLEKRLFWKK